MQRSRVIAIVAGVALLGGAVVLLRTEAGPPPKPPSSDPVSLAKFLDDRVEYRPEGRLPVTPVNLKLSSLDPASLRVGWDAAEGVGYSGYEVRWLDQVRYVLGTQTEITGLEPGDRVAVAVRAVDADGRRSEPARTAGVLRDVYDPTWQDRLVSPVDHFDGPESLSARRWRVYDSGNNDCLGLRAIPGGKRLEITCDAVELQANTPLQLGGPDEGGVVGRAVFTTDGPTSSVRSDLNEISIALLPEPFDDLPSLPISQGTVPAQALPPTAVILHITPQGASFSLGTGLASTTHVVPVSGTTTAPTPGVRHRWELRVLPDAVVAVRDGEVLAAAAVAVPWTTARPRLSFHNVAGTTVDSFGVGGQAMSPIPTSVVHLGQSVREAGATSLGNVPSSQFSGAVALRVVAQVYTNNDAPVVVHLDDKSVTAKTMYPWASLGPNVGTVVYADFPLPDASLGPSPKVRLTSTTDVDTTKAQIVLREGPNAPNRPLPRLSDRRPPESAVGRPHLTLVHESGAAPATRFPPGGKVQVVVEVASQYAEVAPIAGIQIDLDGQRLVTLPTTENGPSPGGRYEFSLDTAKLSRSGHRVDVRVLPQDPRLEVLSTQGVFEIAPA